MAITIDKAFINEYRNLVIHLAQQSATLVRPHVTEVSSGGETYSWDRLGATDALAKTTRRATTPYVDDVWSRRLAVPTTWNHNMTFEHEDTVQMIIDPQGPYARNQAMAMARKYDDLIIASATGTALDGDGSTTTAFPAGQKLGTGIAAISFADITKVQEIFLSNEIGLDVPKVMVVGPVQVRQLMALTQATSADYVQTQALQQLSATGIVANWMGMTWIVSNRLLASSAGKLSCLCMTRDAIGLAVNDNMMIRIGEDPSKSYMNQVYAQFTAGAVRIEDEQIVHLEVLDS
jgi:hypothetical protein